MDTGTLISETAQLYNQAASARTSGDEVKAVATLGKLYELLKKELVVEAPAEPKTPAEPSED